MTKSYNLTKYPEADYTPSDIGPPDFRYDRKHLWKHHTPEWEGMSNEEKSKWIEDNYDKLEEMKLDLI